MAEGDNKVLGVPTPGLSPFANASSHGGTRRPDLGSAYSFTDKLARILHAAEDEEVDLNTELEYAVCLQARRMGTYEFSEVFNNNNIIRKKILGSPINEERLNSGDVIEVYAHVPGLTEMLPEPDMKIVGEYLKVFEDFRLADEALSRQPGTGGKTVDLKKMKDHYSKNLDRIIKDYLRELKIITMYPRFYKSVEDNVTPGISPGEVFKIKFFESGGKSSKDRARPVPTKCFGEYLEKTNYFINFAEATNQELISGEYSPGRS